MNLTSVHPNSEDIGTDIGRDRTTQIVCCGSLPQPSTSAMSDLAWGARTHGMGEGSKRDLSVGSPTQDRPHYPCRPVWEPDQDRQTETAPPGTGYVRPDSH